MLTKPIVINFYIGCALLAIGLIPGLLQAIQDEMEDFRDRFPQLPKVPRQPPLDTKARLPGQMWMAAGGVLLILISALAFLKH
jgi:hypothetical protein